MELRILSESPAPAARDATMAAEITEHPMRFLSWKTACTAALSAPLLALAQQPSDYAREKRWAGEVVPSIVVGEAVWLEAPRTEKFLGIYTEAKNAKGAIVLAHGLGVHPDYGLIGELRARLADAGYTTLSISSGEFVPLKRVKFPVYDVYAEKDYDVVLQGAQKRAALLKRVRGSSQTMMFATDHFFAKREKELVALIRLLLEGEKR